MKPAAKEKAIRCYCSRVIVMVVAVAVVGLIMALCDQYTTNWLLYFNRLLSNITIPL